LKGGEKIKMAKTKNFPKTNVTSKGITIMLWAIVTLFIIDALAKINIINLSTWVGPVFIPVAASLFLAMEIGLDGLLKKKMVKFDAIGSITLVLIGFALLGAILFMLNVQWDTLTVAQGLIEIGIAVFTVIHIFKR